MQPQTIGDHIRRRRLNLKVQQKHVAGQAGVDKSCIYNWEANRSNRQVNYLPVIIEFLGYNSLPPATSMAAAGPASVSLAFRRGSRHGASESTRVRWLGGSVASASRLANSSRA
jgi:hypothetical protein